MRNIIFRGRDSKKWYYGDLENNLSTGVARIHSYNSEGEYIGQNEVSPETVGQYIGKKDKGGEMIFEGDIFNIEGVLFVKVVYDKEDCSFCVKMIHGEDTSWWLPLSSMFCKSHNVIGNIYDNKELL